MFFDASSYVDPKQVSDMFKYNDITDNPYGLDFTSVELRGGSMFRVYIQYNDTPY